MTIGAKKPKPEVEKDPETGRFLTGNIGGGRTKGSRNKLSEDFVAVLFDDFTANGKTAIEACRTNSPETYVKVIAGLLPKEMHIREAPLEDMSDDDIRDALARIAALRTALLGGDGAEAAGRSKPEGQSKPH